MTRSVMPLTVALLCCFASAAVDAQRAARDDTVYAPSACPAVALPAHADTVDRVIVADMRAEHIPAVEVAILHDGRIESRTYGYANLEHCVPADAAAVLGIGSVSKPLTAYATLRLVQAGKLRLDDPITKYIPEAKPAWDGITVRHLMTHTSGIRDYIDDQVYPLQSGIDRKAEVPPDSIIAQFARAPLNFAPGSKRSYSGAGYIVLSTVLERAAGESFPDLMRTFVYAPLGMRSTRPWDPTAIIPDLGIGYAEWDGGLRHGAYVGKTFGRYGDTNILSTAGDLARFAEELAEPRVLDPQLRRVMDQPVRLTDGTELTNNGHGLYRGDDRGLPMLAHAGKFIVGYSADLVVFPANHFAVAVATNQIEAHAEELALRIALLANDSLRFVPSVAPARDPDPSRTERVLRFFRGDSTALAMTPAFRAVYGSQLRAQFSAMTPRLESVTFLGCDDVRRTQEYVYPNSANECYYRLRLGSDSRAFAVYFSRDGAITGIAPKFE